MVVNESFSASHSDEVEIRNAPYLTKSTLPNFHQGGDHVLSGGSNISLDGREDCEAEISNPTAATALHSNKFTTLNTWYQTNAEVYFDIFFFALIGCAIRIGMQFLLGPSMLNIENAGSMIFVAFFANMFGSTILGILVGSSLKSKPGMGPIYSGLTTGLCGSITTYSEFNQEVSEMIIGETDTIGGRYFTVFGAIVLGIAVPMASFKFGYDISTEIRKFLMNDEDTNVGNDSGKFGRAFILTYSIAAIAIILWFTLLGISIANVNKDRVVFVCLSIILSPFGAFVRFTLSKLNSVSNTCITRLTVPRGTLLANLLGSTILSLMDVVLMHVVLSCSCNAVLRAVKTGFCGCLSTVSTLVSEISSMRTKGDILSSHFYPLLTVVICQLVVCTINGVSLAIHARGSILPGNETCS